jgi:acetyltransferase-like isoleucine patch superfamily enzyme
MEFNYVKRWVKVGDSLPARIARITYKSIHQFEIPLIRPVHGSLYRLHKVISGAIDWTLRVFYWTPLFKSRLVGPAPRMNLYGGMPYLTGPTIISIGRDSRISGATTFSGRSSSEPKPRLIIGDNVGIGWQTTIAVGSCVKIGNNVRIAGRAFLAGYPGHPLNAKQRAAGLPDLDIQVGDIILEDDVWLGTGVTVSAGVRIGAGSIVAAGSIVTKDLPPRVLAGGSPAKIIRPLSEDDDAVPFVGSLTTLVGVPVLTRIPVLHNEGFAFDGNGLDQSFFDYGKPEGKAHA